MDHTPICMFIFIINYYNEVASHQIPSGHLFISAFCLSISFDGITKTCSLDGLSLHWSQCSNHSFTDKHFAVHIPKFYIQFTYTIHFSRFWLYWSVRSKQESHDDVHISIGAKFSSFINLHAWWLENQAPDRPDGKPLLYDNLGDKTSHLISTLSVLGLFVHNV